MLSRTLQWELSLEYPGKIMEFRDKLAPESGYFYKISSPKTI